MEPLPGAQAAELEKPYPLARNFSRRVLPALIAFLVVLIAVMGITIRQATREVYLQRAIRTADIIVRDVSRGEPALWLKMITGGRPDPAEHDRLRATFAAKLEEYQLIGIKIYDLERRTIYSADRDEIGKIETVAALQEVIRDDEPVGQRHLEADGSEVLELYLPHRIDRRLVAVLELYEPLTGGLVVTSRSVVLPAIALLTALLGLMIAIFLPFVRRAQTAINLRTSAIVEMRQRIERLVSRSAVRSMRNLEGNERPRDQRVSLTLYYSDARGFTAFSEPNSPERVIEVLNELIGLQVDILEAHGGDVDKIIGDAVLARFDGEAREKRAIEAAIAIQDVMASSRLPLGIGIGIYSGQVVVGLIGTDGRLDYTVIGDSVNISARLSSEAEAGEIIADAATVEAAAVEGFGKLYSIHVAGRVGSLDVRSQRPGTGRR